MATKEEHNKYLAYSHLGFGAFQLLIMLLMLAVSFIILGSITAANPRDPIPVAMVAVVFIIGFLLQLALTLPSLIAGFGLLKRRHWAKKAAVIAGVLSSLSFPFGVAVTVYTFWFLFGENGKELYERQQAMAGGQSDFYFNESSEDANAIGKWSERKRAEYVPPKEMPNWRD